MIEGAQADQRDHDSDVLVVSRTLLCIDALACLADEHKQQSVRALRQLRRVLRIPHIHRHEDPKRPRRRMHLLRGTFVEHIRPIDSQFDSYFNESGA